MTHFTLRPLGPLSLAPVQEMACGFLRGSRICDARGGETVKLAFPRDGSFEPVGVSLRLVDGAIEGDVASSCDPAPIAAQVARVLALDHDARPFEALLASDAVLAPIARARPGFRPVVAYSPYVMAGWSVLSQRLAQAQAAAAQVKIAEAAGDVVTIDGVRVASFPRPSTFLARSSFPGIADEKWRRLQAVARAALEGTLAIEHLTAMPYVAALAKLRTIHGVGPWTAEAILVRGCGPTDSLPLGEPTLNDAVGAVYGLGRSATEHEVERIAETWRPFRTWVSVLLVASHGRMSRAPRGARRSAA